MAKAIQSCVADQRMFNFQVLAKVLSKLVELSPIPQLFMLVRDRTPSSAPPLLWLLGAERRVACRSCSRRRSIGLRTDSRCHGGC